MARLTVKDAGISAVYGAVDIGLEMLDEKQGWDLPFQNSTDIVRTAAALGGAVGSLYVRDPVLADGLGTLTLSAIPLFEKTVLSVVRKLSSKSMGVGKLSLRAPSMPQARSLVGAPRGLTLEEQPSIF